MQIVIGGAFNGKSEWVREQYKDASSLEWIDFTKKDQKISLPKDKNSILVLTAIEELTKAWLESYSIDKAREIGQNWIQELLVWEKEEKNRLLVLIATDFSKGIVPIEKKDRNWRDLTGWFYQDLIKEADRVDEVWYGLATQLK